MIEIDMKFKSKGIEMKIVRLNLSPRLKPRERISFSLEVYMFKMKNIRRVKSVVYALYA
jgi:hypothetical protein